ncbi:glucose-inhibited division protein A [Scytonema sp. HK-05]|uniref:FAD-dependent oxidoreductase n=1 Tax=Scytonema sp. HK-05 TaxID=1137095 RepID=UPI000936309F|nr:FAD-binding protein [Scytonema sp. HK-05]OKH54647.1 pyridine nucleotide-disulfide oxidoreductase [Scytonema sp. HK-05]BAY49000.1 glucose-inhibited division protein A [Scytonema sp. HK-05]
MSAHDSEPASTLGSHLDLEADVLVIGGGPAGTWAAWSAATQGAKVILADKGYCGTSGATAAAGTTVWYISKEANREAELSKRETLGGFLCDRHWMNRVLDQARINLNRLVEWGYPFSVDDNGHPYLRSLHQGAEYMRLMRKQVKKAGVKILDHSPALELLVDIDGGVAGAKGISRQTGDRWTIRAGAVILATGGCAFLSKTLGCNVLTGDGYLMAAEAGAELSGMEFSNAYALTPAFASVTKGAYYRYATFTYEDGTVIEGDRRVIARTLLTQPVYACIDKASEEERSWMQTIQHNFFLPFERVGIDPFTQRFPVTLRLEGTVRGTGGLRIVDETCATSVPGLYAVGDAATRELICGGGSGGGSPNAAWASASGCWAGEAAASYARQLGDRVNQRSVQRIGGAALHPDTSRTFDPTEVIRAVQAEVIPYDRNLFRTEQNLSESLDKLHELWVEIRNTSVLSDKQAIQAREAAAMVATARWMYATALERKESRGMHKHEDYPQLDAKQQHRLLSGGLDRVWVKPEQDISVKELVKQ